MSGQKFCKCLLLHLEDEHCSSKRLVFWRWWRWRALSNPSEAPTSVQLVWHLIDSMWFTLYSYSSNYSASLHFPIIHHEGRKSFQHTTQIVVSRHWSGTEYFKIHGIQILLSTSRAMINTKSPPGKRKKKRNCFHKFHAKAMTGT